MKFMRATCCLVAIVSGLVISAGGVAYAAPPGGNGPACGYLPQFSKYYLVNNSAMSCADAINLTTAYLNRPVDQSGYGNARMGQVGDWTCSARGAAESSEDNIFVACAGPGGTIDLTENQ